MDETRGDTARDSKTDKNVVRNLLWCLKNIFLWGKFRHNSSKLDFFCVFTWFSKDFLWYQRIPGPIWVNFCWSWNANNRNIVAARSEFIAGDWITWWRFKFRLYTKKILSDFIFKSFEIFQKIFSFSKIEKSDFFWFWLLEYFPFSENISQISIFQISISQISKRQNRKISDFSILENEIIFWNF